MPDRTTWATGTAGPSGDVRADGGGKCEGDIERTFKADEVRKILDRLQDEDISHTENVPETIEGFAKAVVEDGTLTPDCNVTADISLTLRERVVGRREQDMTAMLILGVMLGTALERDVPMDSALEDAWRDGAFVLPGRYVDTETKHND